MKLQKINNSNTINNKVSFGDLGVVSLYKIPKNKRIDIVNAFKQEIGDGLINMPYIHDGKTISQDIFIGFIPSLHKKQNSNIDKILVATGGALSVEKHMSKENQIDFILFEKINELLNKFNIDRKGFFKGYGHTLGNIRKENDKIGVCMSGSTDKWWNNYRKGLNANYKDFLNIQTNNWYTFNKNGDNFEYSKVIEEYSNN